jgi:competence protein ComEC
MKVLQFPLARITIGFILGIVYVFYLKLHLSLVFGFLILSVFLFGISYMLQKKILQTTIYFGLATYFFSFCIGAVTQITHTDSYRKNHYTHHPVIFEKQQLIALTINEKLKSTQYGDRYIAEINHIGTQKYSGKIILNLTKDSLKLPSLESGTSLAVFGKLYKNRPPNNPDQFDYGNYLAQKQIYAQLYLDAENLHMSTEFKKDIWYYASKLRNTIIHNLEKTDFKKTELHVAAALIMGQRQDISPEIIQNYQYAGAIHILSVSGLHIGLILIFINFILKPIPNTRKGSWIKLTLILVSLSLFGILAGLAPSVVRSVTMFSFVAIGQHLRRGTNIYHTILVSMLLILLFQPSFLFDVGFQLSYLALFFIIWLQPILAAIWSPKSKITNYIWDILTVSFAAQIGTLPLSLFYFHQFPGLFFITNLAVIPLLSCIMILGLLVMTLAAFHFVPTILVKPFEWSIYFLNTIINKIASFEQFIIQDIPFNSYLLLNSYLLIITIILWFKKPSFNKLVFILAAVLFCQFAYMRSQYTIEQQNEWVVFNVKRNTLITERNGKNTTVFTNDNLLKKVRKNSILKSYLLANFSDLKRPNPLKNLYYFNENKILVLDSLGIYSKNIQPDIIILTQSPKINFNRLLQTLKPKMVVADASNYKTLLKYWEASCEKQKIPFHATAEKGFYKLN